MPGDAGHLSIWLPSLVPACFLVNLNISCFSKAVVALPFDFQLGLHFLFKQE